MNPRAALSLHKAHRRAQREAQRQESLAAWAAWRAQQQQARAKHNIRVFGWLLAIVCLCATVTGLSHGGGWPVLFLLGLPLFWFRNGRLLPDYATYRALPHAQTVEGKHRCIFCGHRTVTRSSSDLATATASCERCRRPLYRGHPERPGTADHD